ncbi:sporulation protein [Halobacillus dabanensis]|nr:sporulation protein [Halobacillus dabanensis]
MMLAKLFSWFGPGYPKVDLVLAKREYTPGEKVTGSFHLQGGLRQVKIHRLECDLVKKTPGRKPRFIQPVTTVLMNRELGSKAETEYPFHFLLPEELLEEADESSYHLQTKLVLKNDVETTDTDEIHIRMSSI